MDMQNQLQQQTRNLFGSFPFPNFGGTAAKTPGEAEGGPETDKGEPERGKSGGENKG
jgi:hypothetical protein